jgi:hypothetical protein
VAEKGSFIFVTERDLNEDFLTPVYEHFKILGWLPQMFTST